MLTTQSVDNPQNVPAPAAPRSQQDPRRHEEPHRAGSGAFEAVFAQLAQFAAAETSRSGTRSLGVGKAVATRTGSASAPARLSSTIAAEHASPDTSPASVSRPGSGSTRQSLAQTLHDQAGERPDAAPTRTNVSRSSGSTIVDRSPHTDTTENAETRTAGRSGPDRTHEPGTGGQPKPSGAAVPAGSTAASRTGRIASTGAQALSGTAQAKPAAAPQSPIPIGVSGGRGSPPNTDAARARPTPPASHNGRAKASATFRAQLVQGLGAALRRGEGDVSLKLTPRALGELRVNLRVRDGAVNATLKPATVEARGLLEDSIDTLRHALEARGLKVARIEIEQPPAAKEGTQGQQQRGLAGQEGHPGEHGGTGQDHQAEPGVERDARGGGARQQHPESPERDAERDNPPDTPNGKPGVVYRVADGAARIVMVDALA